MKRLGEQATREALNNGAMIREYFASYRIVDAHHETLGFIVSDLFGKLYREKAIKFDHSSGAFEYYVSTAQGTQKTETSNETTQDTNNENAAQESTQGAQTMEENNMENKNKLLSINPKAFQALHAAKRFDFQKPYTIISGDSSFTLRSVAKAIEKEIHGDYTAAMLIKRDCDWRLEQLRYVDITESGFNLERVQSLPYWEYRIDWFLSKGDFEETRKRKTEIYFVVAQSVDNLSPEQAAKPYDLTQRFRIISDVTHGIFRWSGVLNRQINSCYLTDFSGNPKKFKYEPHRTFHPKQSKSDNILDYVDKSGYIVWEKRKKLFGKALKLRAEREKAAAAAADFSERENATQERLNHIKTMVSERLSIATTEAEFKNAENAIRFLKWATYHLFDYRTKAKHNGFSSIKRRVGDLDHVDEYLNKAMEAINNGN